MSASRSLLVRALLADGSLCLSVDPDAERLVGPWLPRLPDTAIDEGEPAATIAVVAGTAGAGAAPMDDPTLRLGAASAWVRAEEERAALAGSSAGSTGTVWLREGRAELRAGPGATEAVEWELYSMLTISAALLLGRQGRALVHAGAAVAPGGGAWALVGDARSGKSTTCVNLIEAGWDYVSDDQVVLARGDGGEESLRVEGWPRAFHLDAGWERGRVTGRRLAVDPTTLGPGRWRRSAPLAGVLFPGVTDGSGSGLEPIPQAEALSLLVRQTPWLLADRPAAPTGLELLTAAARRPAFRLQLGLDTYRDKDALLACLRPLLDL